MFIIINPIITGANTAGIKAIMLEQDCEMPLTHITGRRIEYMIWTDLY
jgi:hypothetical protein